MSGCVPLVPVSAARRICYPECSPASNSVGLLPQILRDFRRDNPLVDYHLTVDQGGLLHQRLAGDKLDVFIGKRPSGEQRGQLIKRESLRALISTVLGQRRTVAGGQSLMVALTCTQDPLEVGHGRF
jgi:DNA-binding transcriptional LysR family regulator